MKKLLLTAVAAAALFGTSAFATDMPQRPVYKAAPAAQLFNWSGFYVGGYAGWMEATSRDVSGGAPPIRVIGGAFGGLAGVNWQNGNFVYGLEGDGGWSTADHGTDFANFAKFEDRFIGNVRARAGVAVDRTLFFVAGGAAFTNEKVTHIGGTSPDDHTRAGWTVGGGIDYAASQNWIFRVEYLYANFSGDKTYDFISDQHTVSYDNQNTVRAAAIYKW